MLRARCVCVIVLKACHNKHSLNTIKETGYDLCLIDCYKLYVPVTVHRE